MHILTIAWFYVALMMTLAEATNPNGSLLGALLTFLGYGLVPVGLLWYFLQRNSKNRAKHRHGGTEPASSAPNDSGHAAGAQAQTPCPPVREKE